MPKDWGKCADCKWYNDRLRLCTAVGVVRDAWEESCLPFFERKKLEG